MISIIGLRWKVQLQAQFNGRNLPIWGWRFPSSPIWRNKLRQFEGRVYRRILVHTMRTPHACLCFNVVNPVWGWCPPHWKFGLCSPPPLMDRAGGFQCGPSMWTFHLQGLVCPLVRLSTTLRGLTVAPPTPPPLWLSLWIWGFPCRTAPSRHSAVSASPRSWAFLWSPLTRIWDVPPWEIVTMLSVAATPRGIPALPMNVRLEFRRRRRMMRLS